MPITSNYDRNGISGNNTNINKRLFGEYDYHYRSLVQHKKPSELVQGLPKTGTISDWYKLFRGGNISQPEPKGHIWSNSSGGIYCDTYDKDDEVEMIVDMSNNTLTFRKNNGEQGTLDLITKDDVGEVITYRLAVSLLAKNSSVSIIDCGY